MGRRVLRKEFVLPSLAELFRELEDVEVAILFGSLARGESTAHDVDVAIPATP